MTLSQRVCSTVFIAYLAGGEPSVVFAQAPQVAPPAVQNANDLAASNVTIDFELMRGCLLPESKESKSLTQYGMALNPPQPRLGRLNTKCDHQRLLAEGASIHALNYHYQKRKAFIAKALLDQGKFDVVNHADKTKTVLKFQAAVDAALIEHMAMDGTCLMSEVSLARRGDVSAAKARCSARLTLALSDAEQSARKEIIRLGEARVRVAVDKEAAADLAAISGGADRSLPDAPKKKIGKDVLELAKPIKQAAVPANPNAQQPKTSDSRRLLKSDELAKRAGSGGVSDVKFGIGKETADAAALAKSGNLYGTKQEDLSKIDGRKTGDATLIEVADDQKQASFAKELGDMKDNAKKMDDQKVQQREERDMKATVEAIKAGAIKRLPDRPLVSELAFVELAELMLASAKERKEKDPTKRAKLGEEAMDDFDVTLPLGDNRNDGKSAIAIGGSPSPASSPNAKKEAAPLDQQAKDRIKEVDKAIDAIKNDPPT